MIEYKFNYKFYLVFLLFWIGILGIPMFCYALNDDVQSQIEEKKKTVQELESKIDQYKKAIQQKQKETVTLKNQLDIIDTRVEKSHLEIKTTNVRIEATEKDIQLLNLAISDKSQEIFERKQWISSLLRGLNRTDQTDYLEKFVTNQSVSELISERQYVMEVSKNINTAIHELITENKILEEKKSLLEQQKKELKLLNEKLEDKKSALQSEQNRKKILINETQESEKKFQTLLAQLKRQARSIESEIYSLEEQQRSRLKREGKLKELGDFYAIWPVSSRYVTARFHDPEYPFRHVFEHPGTDIRAVQGTPVMASATGYVGLAKNNGMGYSYVLLIHGNGFSTVYGHVSKIYVKQGEFVQQGDIIAASGGTPGTPGAGTFVTGPHLHFEIRKDGIPLDASQFLP